MSATVDCGQITSARNLPLISYFQRDTVACAAVQSLRTFLLKSWEECSLHGIAPKVLVLSADLDISDHLEALQRRAVRLIVLSDTPFANSDMDALAFAYVPPSSAPPLMARAIESALHSCELREQNERLTSELEVASAEIEELDRVGVALSAEHELSKLLDLILTKARQITAADAGSIYLVEQPTQPKAESAKTEPFVIPSQNMLRFAWAQNDSVELPFKERLIEISDSSIAGHVALTGECVHLDDAYNPPPGLPYAINRSFDAHFRYRTKSILAVPMRDEKDQVVGVLQLMNSRRSPLARLTSPAAVDEHVIPFTPHHRDLILSLASQAAVALQNSRLLASIENLFEGFVRASVVAIEQRDPTTCGHSERVAQMTLALAEAVNRTNSGKYADVQFTPAQMKELRYAALLHDFGKVGVREDVLLKAQKLFPWQLELLRYRFQLAKFSAETESLRAQLQCAMDPGAVDCERAREECELRCRLHKEALDSVWELVQQCNLPTLHSEKINEELASAVGLSFLDVDGVAQPLIQEKEARLLSIPKGSLDPDERAQMEGHVKHTVHFLSQIPWTTEVRDVTSIAGGHHEKLNGSGYPNNLCAPDIPIQTRMMTIVDIFDGLTAGDRPYKKAVSAEGALAILRSEVRSGAIDPELFELFSELVHQGIVHAGETHEQSSAMCDRSAIA